MGASLKAKNRHRCVTKIFSFSKTSECVLYVVPDDMLKNKKKLSYRLEMWRICSPHVYVFIFGASLHTITLVEQRFCCVCCIKSLRILSYTLGVRIISYNN